MIFKKIITFIFLIILIISGKSHKHKEEILFKSIEAEKLDIEGGYNIINEGNYKFVRVNNFDEMNTVIKVKVKEPSVLWMNARMIDVSEISLYINDKKMPLKKNLYYFKWMKLGEFNNLENINIKIKNEFGLIEIDKFYITKPDIFPFAKEYVIDDIKADYNNKKVKILFSGEDLTYADVYLYRKMTAESYIKYLEKKYGKINRWKKLWILLGYLYKSHIKINHKKIESINDYFIYDEKPESGYEYEYYVMIENLFGQSLKSKRITVSYDAETQTVTEKKIYNELYQSYSFERYKNHINCQEGFLQETKTGTRLYIDKKERIKNLPSFLKGSYYFLGLSGTANVKYNTNKLTDIYVYVPDLDKSFKDYYIKNGYHLIRTPVILTDKKDKEYSYFYTKRIRKGSGDAVYLKNTKNDINLNDSFSLLVDGNDIMVYFNAAGTLLENQETINISYNKNNQYYYDEEENEEEDSKHNENGSQLRDRDDLHKGSREDKSMVKLQDNLWSYRIKNGAVKYKELDFEFYNDDYNESYPEWTWNIYDYYMNHKNQLSSVVFFKELDTDNADIDFTSKYHSLYTGFEGYLLDDGTVKNIKGAEKSYGMNKVLNIMENELPSIDNTKGYYDGSFLTIEYISLDSKLTDSDYIRIIYSYDDWVTEDDILLENTGHNRWKTELYPPGDKNIISFYFTNDDLVDDNMQCKWHWNYRKNVYFNTGYERNILKQRYLELKPYMNNEDENYYWSIDTANGIYDVYAVIEKTDKYYDGAIEINGKSYQLDETYNEMVEIRDKILVYENKIELKNTGDYNLKLYGFFIKKDKKLINMGFLKPVKLKYDHMLFDEEITDPVTVMKTDGDVIKIEFETGEIDPSNLLEFVFHASATNKNLLSISTGGDFDETDLVSQFEIDNDLKEYAIDLSDYIEQFNENDGNFTLYIKGNKGFKILTHINEIGTMGLKTSFVLGEESEVYEGMGVITGSNADYIFTEDGSGVSYESDSNTIDLGQYINSLVVVTGYIENEKLSILKVTPVITIKAVEGDTYTNNQMLEWNIISDFNLTGLKYRIKDITDWKIMAFGTIIEEVADDGDYTLEVIPMMNGHYGAMFTHDFIVDRTGPVLQVTGDLPEYTHETQFEFGAEYTDNYTEKEDITVYYRINDWDNTGDEIETAVTDGKININASGANEGPADILLYAKDSLGNQGNTVIKKTFFDFMPPLIKNIKVSYDYGKDDTGNVYQDVVIQFEREDNITGSELTTFYKVSNEDDIWHDTTSDIIRLAFDAFDTDGEYQITAYVKDLAGLISDEKAGSFIIDRIPIDMPTAYDIYINNNFLTLYWSSEKDDPSFLKYSIRRDPEFKSYTSTNLIDNTFTDNTSIYNPDYTYYVSVHDIYGNVSTEFECPAIKYNDTSGNTGDNIMFEFEYGKFELTVDEKTPEKIGFVRRSMQLDDFIQGEYNIFKDEIYHLEPEEAVFTEPAVWTIDISDINNENLDKNLLTLYTFDKINKKWLEVETEYDEDTDSLKAKIYHFSDYAIGQKKENRVEVPSGITDVSAENGNLNANINLFQLSSHKGQYNLQLKFGSGKFDDMSKKTLSDKIYNQDLSVDIIYDEGDINEVNYLIDEKERWAKEEWVEENPYVPGQNLFNFSSTQFEYNFQFKLEDNSLVHNTYQINQVDNAWSLNIPELKKQEGKLESDEFKFVKFEDGIEYELKPHDDVYKNIIGRKFIYKALKTDNDENIYLVKISGYTNYLFNNEGKCEFVFYSADPENIINTLLESKEDGDYEDKRIMYSFEYDEDYLIKYIKSHNNKGVIISRLDFKAEKIYDVDDTEQLNSNYYIKRINSITKEIKQGTDYLPVKKIELGYTDYKGITEADKSILHVKTHNNETRENKNNSLFIEYERLDYVKTIINPGSITGKEYVEETSFDYSTLNMDNIEDEEKAKYKVIGAQTQDLEGKVYVFQNEKEKFITSINGYQVIQTKLIHAIYEIYNIDMPVKVENTKVAIAGDEENTEFDNYYFTPLTQLIINEKNKISTYQFDTYKRGKDSFYISQEYWYSICTGAKIELTDENNKSIPLVKEYFYKENPDQTLMPFTKSLIITDYNEYELNGSKDDEINNRTFQMKTPVKKKYQFAENIIGLKMGVIERREGIYKGTEEGIDDLRGRDNNKSYFKEGTLEKNLGESSLYYSTRKLSIGSNYKVNASLNSIKKPDSDEVLINKSLNQYNQYELLEEEIYFISETETKSNRYYYEDYAGINSEENIFLNPLLKKTENAADKNTDYISITAYKTGNTGINIVDYEESYLNDKPEIKNRIDYEYNENDMVIKETVNDERGSEYIYDDKNRVKYIIGKAKTYKNTDEEIKEITTITKKYYDNAYSRLLGEETFILSDAVQTGDEYEMKTGTVNLYYYDHEGIPIATAALYYEDGTVKPDANVKIIYNEETTINDVLTISGEYTLLEDAAKHTEYHNQIKNSENSLEYVSSLNQYEDYYQDNIIAVLKNNKFDFEKSGIKDLDYISASQVFAYMGLTLLEENYSRNPEDSSVEKIYVTYKSDMSGNVLERRLDDARNNLVYSYNYDEFGSLTKEISPDGLTTPIEYETIYSDYDLKKIAKKLDGSGTVIQEVTTSHDNMGNMIYKKIKTKDAIDYHEEYEYDYQNRPVKKTDAYGITETYQYNLYGIIESQITSSDGESLTSQYNIYDSFGNSIYEYSQFAVNKKQTDKWSSKKTFNGFNEIMKEEIRYDENVIEDTVTGETYNIYKIYDDYGRVKLETTDKYTGIYEKLDDTEYEYNVYGELTKKTTYSWDNKNNKIIKIDEKQYYDRYHRVTGTISIKDDTEVLKKTFTADYDANNNICLQYEWSKGSHWSRTENIYENGNLIRVERSIIDEQDSLPDYNQINDDNKEALKNELEVKDRLQVNYKYTTYDKFYRVKASADFDGNGVWYVYDTIHSDKIIQEYSGINFDYQITDGRIDESTKQLKTPIQYYYDNTGNLIKQEMTGISKNEYFYDKYGRVSYETINRYKEDQQKKRQYFYDGFGRTNKTITDEVTEEVIKWPTDGINDYTQKWEITIESNGSTQTYFEEKEMSIYGSIISSTDRDHYKYTEKYNKYGNITFSNKTDTVTNNEIFQEINTYDPSQLYLEENIIKSSLGNDKKIIYQYDEYARIENIKNYEVIENADELLTEKIYQYNNADQVTKLTTRIEGESFNINYQYGKTGVLESITYPDGKICSYDYDINNGDMDGMIRSAKFDNQNIISDIKYYNEEASYSKSNRIERFKNGTGITSSYQFDKAGRLLSKSYKNTNDELILNQSYTFDRAGNITSINETGTGLTGYFKRDFEYDEYNRLINAEYNGRIIKRLDPKLTYFPFDYDINDFNLNDVGDLAYDNDNIINIETKASSIIITDSKIPGQEFNPSIIKILKQNDTMLNQEMILPYYLDGSNFVELNPDDYTLTDENDFFVYKDWDIKTNALKFNFVPDDSDLFDESIEENYLDRKFDELIEFYSEIDNIDFTYEYDVMGNRTRKSETLYRENRTIINKETDYKYTYKNNKRYLDEDGIYKYEYDIDGFLIKKIEISNETNYWEYTWNAAGNLRKVTKYENSIEAYYEEYIYDESGQRVKTITLDNTTIYIYDGLNKLFEKTIGEEIKTIDYVYALGELQCIIEDGEYSWQYADVLGSTRFITDNTGNIIQESIFSPFGIEILNTHNNGGEYKYFYATHESMNTKTGIQYMNARWMMPELGRFMSSDPAKDGLNWYVYAGNNPTTFIDPTGTEYELPDWYVTYYLDYMNYMSLTDNAGFITNTTSGANFQFEMAKESIIDSFFQRWGLDEQLQVASNNYNDIFKIHGTIFPKRELYERVYGFDFDNISNSQFQILEAEDLKYYSNYINSDDDIMKIINGNMLKLDLFENIISDRLNTSKSDFTNYNLAKKEARKLTDNFIQNNPEIFASIWGDKKMVMKVSKEITGEFLYNYFLGPEDFAVNIVMSAIFKKGAFPLTMYFAAKNMVETLNRRYQDEDAKLMEYHSQMRGLKEKYPVKNSWSTFNDQEIQNMDRMLNNIKIIKNFYNNRENQNYLKDKINSLKFGNSNNSIVNLNLMMKKDEKNHYLWSVFYFPQYEDRLIGGGYYPNYKKIEGIVSDIKYYNQYKY